MTRHLLMRCWEQFCAEQQDKEGKRKAAAQHRPQQSPASTATCSQSPFGLPTHHMGLAYVNLEVKHRGEKAAESFKNKRKCKNSQRHWESCKHGSVGPFAVRMEETS